MKAPAQVVVEEEAFVEGIESILARDFFPHLPKLRLYNQWLDARQSNDLVKMAQIKALWLQQKQAEQEKNTAGTH